MSENGSANGSSGDMVVPHSLLLEIFSNAKDLQICVAPLEDVGYYRIMIDRTDGKKVLNVKSHSKTLNGAISNLRKVLMAAYHSGKAAVNSSTQVDQSEVLTLGLINLITNDIQPDRLMSTRDLRQTAVSTSPVTVPADPISKIESPAAVLDAAGVGVTT